MGEGASKLTKLSILLASSMTVLAGAIIAPALPFIKSAFPGVENIELLAKLTASLPALAIAIFSPFAGLIIDRFGRKKLLLVSLALYAFAGTTGLYLNDIYMILAGRLILGLAVGGIMTVSTTLIGDYFTGEKRGEFLGFQGTFMAAGGVVFITAGGFLANAGWRAPFAVYALSLLVMALASVHIFEPAEAKSLSYDGALPQKAEFNKSAAGLIYSLGLIGMALFYLIPVQIPFLLESKFGINGARTGFAISAVTIFGAAMSYFYGKFKKKASFSKIYTFIFFVMGAGLALISLAGTYTTLIIGIAVTGVGMGMLFPNSNNWLVQIAPETFRGRFLGMLSAMIFAGQFISPLIAQPIIGISSIDSVFLYSGIASMLLSLVLFFIRIED